MTEHQISDEDDQRDGKKRGEDGKIWGQRAETQRLDREEVLKTGHPSFLDSFSSFFDSFSPGLDSFSTRAEANLEQSYGIKLGRRLEVKHSAGI